ncbi:MAG: ATP-dependent RecD-like DNA helicase [Victivallaceae bacterium]|nr:ATP-dependent RecD-like DNA helicase [Victivallaceae bacterium]
MSGKESETETLQGEIVGIRFENPDSDFRVLRVRCDGNEVVVCGTFPSVFPGQWCVFHGSYRTHGEFGRQFHADNAMPTLPGTLDGLRRFLVSSVPGIGPKNAERIVEHFKDETVKVLDKEPERLREVSGIGSKRAAEIAKTWMAGGQRRDGMIFLQGLGVSPAGCAKLYKVYGGNAPQVVRENPYQLALKIDGFGFHRADAIALKLGIAPDSTCRVAAAVGYLVGEAVNQGHTGIPEDELLAKTCELTGAAVERVRMVMESERMRGLIVSDMGLVYLPWYHKAESALPAIISSLARCRDFRGSVIQALPATKTKFEGEQLEAVVSVSRYPLNIITGGPGVGKTTVISEIVRRAKVARLKVSLAAPTGRAAKRLSEASGMQATTIHRLLQYTEDGGFLHGAGNPIDAELLVVDEVSMLDISLAYYLFSAVRRGTSVVLVGDIDQLPSVGPGTVLLDFIAGGMFHVTRLTKVFRQAANSYIVSNAHAVNRGEMPYAPTFGAGLGDFYWIDVNAPDAARNMVGRLVKERIPARFGFDPVDDVQVLTPMNRGDCGTIALNSYLGDLLNGDDRVPGFRHGGRVFRRGAKVMQRVNTYEKGVFNGDIGRIIDVRGSQRKFSVLFDDQTVEYGFDEVAELVHAYAVTVHKSQGCEFPAVVLVMLNSHYVMLQRKLIYTAMTRARKLLVLVGSRRAMELATRNVVVENRHSRLRERFELQKKAVF